MNSNQINRSKELFRECKKATIIPHRSPDGDAIGSCLGAYLYLKKKGVECRVISPNDFPLFLKWLPKSEDILVYEENEIARKWVEESDLILTLDFNHFGRVEPMTSVLEKSKAKFLMIDHHEMPSDYAEVMYSEPEASSTCEMLYDFIEFLGDKELIDRDIATCIYTGIMTDTGCFKFSQTTYKTHAIVSELLKLGVDVSYANSEVFDSYSENRLGLLGRMLNNLVYMEELGVSYYTLKASELREFKFEKGDTEGFVNYGLKIKECVMAVSLVEEEKEGIIKMSFRSKGDLDVNIFARKYFNGGGHKNAAGGRSELKLEETVNKLKEVLREFLKRN